MPVVNIYVESDSQAPRSMQRKTCYVMEYVRKNGELYTQDKVMQETGTYHEVILRTLSRALERINQPCDLHIHTQDEYILQSIENNLERWAVNEWRTKKGDLVKNHFQWKTVWDRIEQHDVKTESGMHAYFSWMQSEMKKFIQKTTE